VSGEEKPAKPKVGNLTARVLTAVVLVPVILALIFWPRHEGWWVFTMIALGASAYEVASMAQKEKLRSDVGLAVVLALGLGALIYWYAVDAPWAVLLGLVGCVVTIFGYVMLRPRNIETSARRVSALFVAVFYTGLLFPFWALLKRLPDGSFWVLLTCTIVWFGDTGAYFTGKYLGRHKLYPKVSPKKTWEGALGGAVASLGACLLAYFWYLPALELFDVFALALPAAVLGQVGDLCESLLKRSYGVKDSGRLLPGHGGALDRLDALIFATPYVFFYAARIVY
jgi:phosphatidate cytidylyltransferase